MAHPCESFSYSIQAIRQTGILHGGGSGGQSGGVGAPGPAGPPGPAGNKGICPKYCSLDGGVFFEDGTNGK